MKGNMKRYEIKSEWHWLIEKIFWRLLKHSGVFWYWYTDFLLEVYYNFEIADIEQKEMMKKYLIKYKEARKHVPTIIFRNNL